MGLVVIDLITSPVVSWRGWETPPPPPAPRLSCHSLLNHRRVKTSLSCGDLLLSSAETLFTFGGWTGITFSRIRRNLFIHIARIPIGDSPRVHPNILKCSLHSPVAKGIRLVVFATRAMVFETPTHYLILNPLALARGCVILRSHFLILLLLIILISHHIHS